MSTIEPDLQLSVEHLRLCFANAATGIVTMDLSGQILAVNPAFTRITGYSADDIIGMDFRTITFEDDLPGAHRDFTRLKTGEVQSYVCQRRYRQKNDDLVWVRASVSTIPDENGIPVKTIAIWEDISALKKLEEQVRQAQKMEALGRFAGGVAHDFNNLLMIINSYASLLTEEFGSDSPMGSKAAAIEEAGIRATELTRHLLAFSRKQVLKTQVTSLDSLVQSSEQMLRRLIREDVEVAFDLNSAGGLIEIDSGQIERVLMNLSVNAVDAMPTGGRLTIATGIKHIQEDGPGRSKAGTYVSLSVTDSGIGMDAATQERIFEPFFTSKKSNGTGLGLSTVYGIIEQSGGHINVQSAPGNGTTFTIYLPAVAQQSEPEARPEKGNHRRRRPIRATVLLVEDEPLLRRCLLNTLNGMGCFVLQAENGAQALELANRQLLLVDLVVTDLVMPRLGGLDLVRKLRTLNPKLPVIFMSGHADTLPTRDELRPDCTQFLQKPFDPGVLRSEVESILQRSRATSPHR